MQALSESVLPYCGLNMPWGMVKLQRSSYRKMNLLLRIQPLYVGIANDHFQILLIKKRVYFVPLIKMILFVESYKFTRCYSLDTTASSE